MLPYIKGITEQLKQLQKSYDIQTTLQNLSTYLNKCSPPSDRSLSEDQTNMYKINCTDCSWSNTGKTGRALKTGRNEHERNLKNCKNESNIANHGRASDHQIDFANRKIIDTASY